jgi:glucose-6-phosphate 1-dehydrogenase
MTMMARAQPKAPPVALVMFGASGDLTARKLLPALASLAGEGALSDGFVLVGIARTPWSDDQFRDRCIEAVPGAKPAWAEMVKRFRYLPGDYDDDATFAKVGALLAELDSPDGGAGTAGNRIYYLATVPSLFGEVAQGLGRHGLNRPGPGGRFARLVIEKPFGHDLETAMALDETLHASFEEDQIYRIDHYMGKETVQNVLALRFANSIFEPVWNRRYVGHVHVTVAESIGVEHRGSFYESAGALRDIVQNHVMQVLALTLMEPSATMDPTSIRDEKVKLLRAVMAPRADEAEKAIVRGQYAAGMIDGQRVPGYCEEEGVDPESQTETFVAMRLSVDNWRWAGVPVYIRTGKRLAKRSTEVVMVFQRPPHLPFAGKLVRGLQPNALILRIQPDEGITLRFGAKVPGQDYRVRTVAMDFSYKDAFGSDPPEAYERLLLDAMIGDPTLFIRTDEVEQAWRLLEPVQEAFAEGYPHLSSYNAGSWGPLEAARLLEPEGYEWVNP